MMRIALFTYEYGSTSRGGVGRYLEQLVPFLRGRGVGVDIFHLHERGAAGEGHHVSWLRTDALTGTDEVIRRSLSRSTPTAPDLDPGEYDVVLCQDWAGVVASEGLWRRGVRLVYTCHLPLDWEPEWRKEIGCQYADQLESYGLAAADAVITVSYAVRDYLHRSHPLTRGKVHVVHNGIDERFSVARHPRDDAGDVAFIGRLAAQKGIHILPEVFGQLAAKVPERRFHIIGSGRLEDELREALQQRGLSSRCVFHGHVDSARLAEVFARIDVVLLPSRHEPFGMIALEAMDAGVAVVASDTDGFKEIIVDGESGFLVDPDDVGGFTDRVRALLDNEALRERIVWGGAARVEEKFRARHSTEATLAVLERVVAMEPAW